MAVTGTYTAADIQVLHGLEGVRRRPGMYLGGVGTEAVHHMFLEVLGNAVDEHLRGHTRNIRIAIDGHRISVEDDGRGIPISELERIMTTLHAGPAPQPHVHLARTLHGVGVAVVSALSSELEAVVWRDGHEYVQHFARGEAVAPGSIRAKTTRTGTRITFTPDFSILEKCPWDVARIEQRCRLLAVLMPRLTTEVDGVRFHYDSMVDYLHWRAACDLIEPFHAMAEQDGVRVELALAWAPRGEQECFVNCTPCDTGVHVEALRAAIRTVLGARIKGVRTKRLEEQLAIVLHVRLTDPRFGDPTRSWLTNPEAGAIVRTLVERELAQHFDSNPALLDQILIDVQRKRKVATRRLRPRTRAPVSD